MSALVVTLASLATLVALEFFVRWAIPAFDPSGHVRFVAGKNGGPVLGPPNTTQRQIKNAGDFDVTVRFNKYGFRDDRDLAQSSPNAYFAIGDSLSFGWGVEEKDRVTEQIEKIIGRPIYNISIPVNIDGAEKLVDYAEANGAKIGTLIYFFSTEARIRNYEAPRTGDNARIIEKDTGQSKHRIFHIAKYWLMDHSALYFLLTSFVHRNEYLEDLAIRAGMIQPNLEGFPVREYDALSVESTAQRLLRFINRRNWRTIVVVLPSRALWVGPSQNVEDKMSHAFIRRLRDMNIEVVDVRPNFEAGGNPLRYYFKNDPHWNAAGHRLVALAVARYLRAHTEGTPR